ncbi:immunity protein Imm33 domain-containing protein [Paenibacillus kobensis]|uniref:immunity protein Imm33 domain-containing protein n=1 Tax=Paenibacillus kobensis TaxID=59841 RepID=UPI000FDB7435|nr:hypothetical protein [Paenibacillus kobensis]
MIQSAKVISGRKFVANCEEFLSPQVEWLLELFKEIEADQGQITSGMKIQIGWTIYTVIDRDGVFEIVAPNYKTNPFSDMSEDLSVSLSVQLAQNHILHKLKIDGEASLFQDKIVVAKGAIDLEKVYLERSKNSTNGDSGWYLGPVEDSNEDSELEAYYIYQLLNLRPSLLKALAIPSGHIVVFEKDEIEAVLDEDDNNIW